MRRPIAALLLAVPTIAQAQAEAIEPGRWDVTSTVVDLAVPGVPGFLQRMARGRSSAEHKRLTAGQGVEALLAPDPKAHCVVDSQQATDGHYAQSLTCPQKSGAPLGITRSGRYDAAGFAGRATVAGTTPKGPMRIVLDQKAVRIGG